MCVCVYVCMCVCMCMCVSACMCACVCVYMHVYVCMCICVYVYVWVCMSVCVYVYVYLLCMHMYVCMCDCLCRCVLWEIFKKEPTNFPHSCFSQPANSPAPPGHRAPAKWTQFCLKRKGGKEMSDGGRCPESPLPSQQKAAHSEGPTKHNSWEVTHAPLDAHPAPKRPLAYSELWTKPDSSC